MTESEFVALARNGQLTDQMVAEFFALPEENIARALNDLAKIFHPETEGRWFGLHRSMAEVICEMNLPQAMWYYVKYYVCNPDQTIFWSELSDRELKWLIEEVDYDESYKILCLYIQEVTLSAEQQELVYLSPHTSLWDKMCEHQEIASELQQRLVRDCEKATGDDAYTLRVKFRDYIKNRKFCFEAEYDFLKSRQLFGFKRDYVKMQGVIERMRDIILVDVWLKQ